MYQAARGTTDILPEEQPYWRYVEKAIADITLFNGKGVFVGQICHIDADSGTLEHLIQSIRTPYFV